MCAVCSANTSPGLWCPSRALATVVTDTAVHTLAFVRTCTPSPVIRKVPEANV